MKRTFPIFLAFLCMGFGDAVSTFVGKAKDTFQLSNFEAQLVSLAGLIMFGVLSVPMGILQDKISKKKTLLIGLALALVSVLTVLIVGVSSYTVFLTSVLLLGAGAAILQVAGNPIMRDVSDEGKYSSNLSLGQFIKAIGSNTAPIVFFVLALFAGSSEVTQDKAFEWNLVFAIFAVGITLTMISVASLKIQESKSEGVVSIVSCLKLLGNGYVLSMVVGIFVYVGAEICVASGMPIYFTDKFGVSSAMATQYVTYFFLAIMIARLVGAFVLRFVKPRVFLLVSAVLAIVGFAMMLPQDKLLTTIALFVIALGYANVFPLIFSMAIDKMPEKSNELSGLMITAIFGGAIIPPVMGFVADSFNVLIGFVVPLCCVIYIFILAIKNLIVAK
ncbi:MAG: sugar MFS transporter [Verrucomicrobiaceae bacterium]|nr:sugar MFS transporter [Verrucomicrobiaceae bacterium]